ncbi:zinc ribbon domain-containing protein [Mangrovibacterium lignilyticum]|uniref:zinc ribbon domain-containing protein n=1 Tax=Mangrovibacterium lignilyticum TaxID=2668052 RepID=UPI0013D8CB01|nr:zinc ribbon domain-containing protein [Mangrovibacterium lignilyticum]
MKKAYQCIKCGNKKAEIDQIGMTGTGFTRFFNIQNRIYTSVSCSNCGYTELYKGKKSGKIANVFDFLGN